MSIALMMPSSHFILWRPLLLLPPIFPSIRVFSNELAVCIRWPKCWSFSFSISPSKEYSGLISLMIDWLPDSSDCGISQARILEWVATSYSRGYSRPEDWTRISCISCFGRQILDLRRKTKKWWQMDSLPLYHLGSPVEACTEHKMGTEKGMSWSNLMFAIWERPLTYFQMLLESIDLFTPSFWCSPLLVEFSEPAKKNLEE